MRRSLAATAALALTAAALCACHDHFSRPKLDADPAGPWGASLDPGERARLVATDDLIRAELPAALAPGGLETARLERDAQDLGFSGAADLEAALDRDCLEPGDVSRFAAARGLGAETAGRYLEARFGAAVCGAAP